MTNLIPDYNNSYICPKCNHQTPQYVKEWVGLTDDEIFGMFGTYVGNPDYNHNKLLIDARRIEEKIKEKNNA